MNYVVNDQCRLLKEVDPKLPVPPQPFTDFVGLYTYCGYSEGKHTFIGKHWNKEGSQILRLTNEELAKAEFEDMPTNATY